MKVAIVGGRRFDNYKFLEKRLDELNRFLNLTMTSISEIISGRAKGADSLAEQYAKKRGIPITIFRPDWEKYGGAAGMLRNADIVRAADMIVAFWDGESSGTKNIIDRTLKAKKDCFVFFYITT